MALQTEVSLAMTKYVAGMQVNVGNARTTRSAAWQGGDTPSLYGKFVQRGAQPYDCRPLDATVTTMDKIFGVVEFDPLNQLNSEYNEVIIRQHAAVSVMTQGGIIVQTDGSSMKQLEALFVITSYADNPDLIGVLTSDAAAGDTRIQIVAKSGDDGSNVVPFVVPYDHIVAGTEKLVTIAISGN